MGKTEVDYHVSILKEVLDDIMTFDDEEEKQEFLLDVTEKYREKLLENKDVGE